MEVIKLKSDAFKLRDLIREEYQKSRNTEFDDVYFGFSEETRGELSLHGLCEFVDIGINGKVIYYPENDK